MKFKRKRPLAPIPAAPTTYEIIEKDEIVAGAIPRDYGVPGIYFLVDKNEIVYVGQTKNLQARIYQHRSDGVKKFTGYFLHPCPPADLTMLESAYMRMYRPKYNVMPRWDRSVAGVIQ